MLVVWAQYLTLVLVKIQEWYLDYYAYSDNIHERLILIQSANSNSYEKKPVPH